MFVFLGVCVLGLCFVFGCLVRVALRSCVRVLVRSCVDALVSFSPFGAFVSLASLDSAAFVLSAAALALSAASLALVAVVSALFAVASDAINSDSGGTRTVVVAFVSLAWACAAEVLPACWAPRTFANGPQP